MVMCHDRVVTVIHIVGCGWLTWSRVRLRSWTWLWLMMNWTWLRLLVTAYGYGCGSGPGVPSCPRLG